MSSSRVENIEEIKKEIPPGLWEYFEKTPGLNINYLINMVHHSRIKTVCEFLYKNRDLSFPLIEFYRDNPPLSLEEFLSYNVFCIRDFVQFDAELKLHKWALRNNLTFSGNFSMRGENIRYLCNDSGIEYLNRKVLSQPKEMWQQIFYSIATTGIEKDMEFILADCLAPIKSLAPILFPTIEERFQAFKLNKIQAATSLEEPNINSSTSQNNNSSLQSHRLFVAKSESPQLIKHFFIPVLSPIRYFDRATIENFLNKQYTSENRKLICNQLRGIYKSITDIDHSEGKSPRFKYCTALFSSRQDATAHLKGVLSSISSVTINTGDLNLRNTVFRDHNEKNWMKALPDDIYWIFTIKCKENQVQQLLTDFINNTSDALIDYIISAENKGNDLIQRKVDTSISSSRFKSK